MSFINLRYISNRACRLLKDKRTIFLLIILGIGAYLRLWNLEHLFNPVHDYDEGIYILQARFLAEGRLPYTDFSLVHPPLYTLVLTALFKIFGYNFFLARYFSVFVSLASIVLIYFTGKKLSRSGTGLVAAALFAVSPDMVYFGRRAVQESLAVFLVILAVYFLFSYLNNNQKKSLFFCGLSIGLAVAAKYIFLPALIAILLTTFLILMGKRFWSSLQILATASFVLTYIAICASFLASTYMLAWALKLPIPVPFFTPMPVDYVTLIVTFAVFLLPLIITIWLMVRKIMVREWWVCFCQVIKQREIWYLTGGAVLGFLVVTAFFLFKSPGEFITQTLFLQNRTDWEFPALIALIRSLPETSQYLQVASFTVIIAIPLGLALLNRRNSSQNEFIIAVSLIISLLFCQFFPLLPRYSISIHPFLILGLACLAPAVEYLARIEIKTLAPHIKSGFMVVTACLIIFMSISFVLLTNYSGSGVSYDGTTSSEEDAYRRTIEYLESVSPQKIYATNPVYPALSTGLKSTLDFDIYASLYLKDEPPDEIISRKISEGVDYIVLDAMVSWWDSPPMDQLARAVRSQGRLVKVIAADTENRIEIYAVSADKCVIFNGNFDQWIQDSEGLAPLGWEPSLIFGNGDSASLSRTNISGKNSINLRVSEDGLPDNGNEVVYASISQKITFPVKEVEVEILPTHNPHLDLPGMRPAGVHFVAGPNAVTFTYTDSVQTEQIIKTADGNNLLVLRHASLGQWNQDTIDLAYYWNWAGWKQPEEITVYLINSTHYTRPGISDFYVAGIRAK